MTQSIHVALAQINVTVGAIEENAQKIIQYAKKATLELGCDLVVFPELALTGYPPEDLLLRPDFIQQVNNQVEKICAQASDIDICIGYPLMMPEGLYNVATFIEKGTIKHQYRKRKLPNYSVFDEKRYFCAGEQVGVIDYRGIKLGISVCEDIWHDGPIEQTVLKGAQCIINLNASPYHAKKITERRNLVCARAKKTQTPIIYVNQVGAQDELVFDGASFAVNTQGVVVHQAASFQENLTYVDIPVNEPKNIQGSIIEADLHDIESIYQALVLGVKDYVNKNKFKGVVIGLSGGIDSALTTAIAVDALGADNVHAIMMPFRYTSDMSKQDAHTQAKTQKINYHVVSIEPMYDAFIQQLSPIFTDQAEDVTEENIQARCRGLVLMAYSNKTGNMVLTTGNKSEMSVGYATLYGDMVGGFNAIKDVPKVLVYQLAQYRNTLSPVIPENVITRAPSAELRSNQIDQDSLPAYEILDSILALYIEQDKSPSDIIAQGFEQKTVQKVITMVDKNEYKRRQAAPGTRISKRAFGRDRRYPITNGYKPI